MSTAFMVHGAYGNSRNHWFPWTRFTLEDCGFTVIAPDFPTPEGQSLENWMKVYSDLSLQFDSESIFIGHSLGVPFLLNILQSLSKPIKAAYFVGGLYKNIDMQEFDPINCTFYQDGFDWDLIKANCGSFTIFHADNDPYVPLEQAKELTAYLDGDYCMIESAGHFNGGQYLKQFPDLIDKITLSAEGVR